MLKCEAQGTEIVSDRPLKSSGGEEGSKDKTRISLREASRGLYCMRCKGDPEAGSISENVLSMNSNGTFDQRFRARQRMGDIS